MKNNTLACLVMAVLGGFIGGLADDASELTIGLSFIAFAFLAGVVAVRPDPEPEADEPRNDFPGTTF